MSPFGAYRKDRQIRGKLARKVALDVSDDGVQHLVFAAKFEHLEIGNIDGGHGAAAFELKPLELIAIAHIEDEEFVAAFQPFEQVSRSPDFIVQSFYRCGLAHCQDIYLGWGMIRR